MNFRTGFSRGEHAVDRGASLELARFVPVYRGETSAFAAAWDAQSLGWPRQRGTDPNIQAVGGCRGCGSARASTPVPLRERRAVSARRLLASRAAAAAGLTPQPAGSNSRDLISPVVRTAAGRGFGARWASRRARVPRSSALRRCTGAEADAAATQQAIRLED